VRSAGGRGSGLGAGVLGATNRLEAFSDGVFAIAITLLVIDRGPSRGSDILAGALAGEWPSYVAYAVSFAVIGIMRVNQHGLIELVASVDRPLLFLNLLLLMFVAFMPSSTALLAEHLQSASADAHLAAAVYSANGVANATGFNLIWRGSCATRGCSMATSTFSNCVRPAGSASVW
jgi:uncharacterized membrane protein